MNTTRTLTLFLALLLLGLLFLALPVSTARAADPVILRVKVNGATSGTTCGTSWATACGLQHALNDLASSGTQLWVAAGTYTPTTALDRTATFELRDGIALMGGFAGTETAVNQRNFTANVTILSGDIGTVGDSSDNAYHVVTAGSGVTNTAMLDGFTVTGGNANGPTSPNDRGGGIYNSGSSSPTLANVTFSGNTAASGGGMFNQQSSPILTNVTFTSNTGTWGGGMNNFMSNPTATNINFISNTASWGGGMYNFMSSSPTLTNATFSGNSTPTGGGAGMSNMNSSNPVLTNVTFTGNTALGNGGGMYNDSNSNPTLANVTFIGNTAGWGGGMYNAASSPTLTDISFSGNSATYGGGMSNSSSSPTLTNVTFFSNTASTYGGAMRNDSSNPALTNVTFYSNTASYGGGMYNASGSPTLKNVTLSGNSATSGGGAMANVDSSNPPIRNTILWGNTASSSPQIYNEPGSAPSLYDSVVQGGYAGGTDIITADPRLGALGNYGGATQTIPLLFRSSAIDAGDDPTCADFDQRGIPRPQGAHCDIGAYESVWVHLPLIRR